MASFGERVKYLRNRSHYTQSQLAEQVGLSEMQIRRYEGDENNPTSDVLMKLATVFKVSVDYLLCRTDNPDSVLLNENDLSPDELELVMAFRRGQIKEALKILAFEPQVDEKPRISSRKKAANS